MKLQHAPGATVLDDLNLVTKAFMRLRKCGKMTRSCKESSTSSSSGMYFALLTERDYLKICCEAITMENTCIFGLFAGTNGLRKKLSDHKKSEATSKATSKV